MNNQFEWNDDRGCGLDSDDRQVINYHNNNNNAVQDWKNIIEERDIDWLIDYLYNRKIAG